MTDVYWYIIGAFMTCKAAAIVWVVTDLLVTNLIGGF